MRRRIAAVRMALVVTGMCVGPWAASASPQLVAGAQPGVCGSQIPATCRSVAPAGFYATECPVRVAVLGADMSAGGRFEVQRALKVGPHTVQLAETVGDAKSAARGLVPPSLLGVVAISSGLLHPLAAGSGLTVWINPAITLDTAETYANALLTAGIVDAEARVAAPTSQQALGTTAMLGLLRAAQAECQAPSLERENLAIREVVLTSELAGEIGRIAAPSLLFTLKNEAAKRDLTSRIALAHLITRMSKAGGVTVLANRMPDLVTFLRDLVSSGVYSSVARAGPTEEGVAWQQSVVRLASLSRPAVGGSGALRRSSTRHAAPLAGTWRGTVVAVSTTGIAARLADGVHRYLPSDHLAVFRDGAKTSLPALHSGDAVTVTTNSSGLAILVRADGVPAARRPASPAAPSEVRASNGPNVVAIAIIAAVILLALLLVPVVVAMLRRRRPNAARKF